MRNRDFAQKRYYRVFRQDRGNSIFYVPLKEWSFQRKAAEHFKAMCEAETPIVFPREKITFTRTNRNVTPAYSPEDIEAEFDVNGKVYNVINNVCPDYSILLEKGFGGIRDEINIRMRSADRKEKDFLMCCLITIQAIEELAERYGREAERVGNRYVKELLQTVPMQPAQSFAQALQAVRFISSMFYLAGNYQLGFGRIDQYLISFYRDDIAEGKVTPQEAEELIGEFFISLNKDTDLYFGVQQGDNGQSMMLGGVKPDGTEGINELTYLFLKVSEKLRLIDPKINLRIDSNTPKDLLLLGCKLTKAGLGFPQYSNDEVVIPALVKVGYSLEDARNYTVAACWEFIIPGKGLDIVNQGAVSFPYAVGEVLKSPDLTDMDETRMEKIIRKNIDWQVKNILENRNQFLLPSPLVSLFFHGTVSACKDVTQCARYRNRGIHGAGSANAADALYLIRNMIRQGKQEELLRLKEAVDKNYEGFEAERDYLRNEFPKVGNGDEQVDEGLYDIFNWFADACEHYSDRRCRIRPGTGSAQFYIWLTNRTNDWIIEPVVGATIDGRRAGEALPSSLAPAQGVKINGLLSVLQSFSVIDYSRIMNGGPITVEFSPSALSTQEGLGKLADILRCFVKMGNQQLQLNVLDYRVLCDAMKHPERHSNLIVRVWGWSGYFCELAPEFQRQVVNRHRYEL
ncbi:pyruvate formate lyase family protein [Parablautia muri]|uniref:Pyruvate formate-lyase n=1 Tax=Parablautia muri TaxID=2320879 RepID=A0A9X5GQZ1_9FIRM|nr:pyruvate formate lyase family protein [Parablautia muri]NBJ92678.1 pyruvate formate-lyase [Parablautia muri]